MQSNLATATPSKTSDEVDISALLGALIDNKAIIIACTVFFAGLGIINATLSTPIYVANTTLQIEQKSSGIGTLIGSGDLLSTSSGIATEIELLKSRQVIGQAVDNLKLTTVAHPRHFPIIGSYLSRRFQPSATEPLAPALFGFGSYAWGGEQIKVFQLNVPPALAGASLVLTAGEDGAYTISNSSGNKLLSGVVGETVEQNGFKIQVTTLVARPGTEFLVLQRSRLGVILGLQTAIRASEKGSGSGILSLSLESPNPTYAIQVLNEVSNLYLRQNVERKSAEAQQSLEFLNEQLPQVRKDLEQAEGALNQYQAGAGSVDINFETQTLLNQIVELEASIFELRLKQEELQRRYTQDHPSYQALISQIKQLQSRRSAMIDEVGNLPETQQKLLRLARDVQVSTTIYTQMLNKTQELDIIRAGTVGNVRIIDDAVVNMGQPVKPKKGVIVVLSTLLGLMLGVAIALLRYVLNRGIENPELIEQIGLPVYASVPFSKEQEVRERSLKGKPTHIQGSHLLLAATNPADLSIEALRSLRTSLHFAMMEAKNNILMISGPSPGVGKSFISANLAAIVAQSGQKVLLVDGDMRKGYLHKLITKEPEPGLSGLLVHTHTLADVVHKTEVEGLHFISRGTIPPNPSELLMHANFQALMDQLSQMYDLVIVDTPPILAVTDAALVGRLAGTSLIVTRFGLNPVKEIELTLQRFRNNGIEIRGAIFNAVEKKAAAYGYGNYGYYQYEYKSDAK